MAGRTRYRWVVFGVLVSAYFFVFVQRVAPNVLAPDLAAAFGLRAGELGLLGSVYFWLYALLQPPLGFLFDRYGVRRLAAASLTLAALGSAVLGLAPAFGLALLGRALLGVGTAPFYLGLNLTIRSWFPRAQFATLAGLMQTIGNLGSLAATQPLALAAGALGWREVTVALGALMLGMAGLVYLLVRDRPEEVGLPVPAALVPDVAERPPLGLALRLTLAQRNVLLLGLMYFLLFGVAVAFQGLWAVPFLIDARGLDRATAAGLMAFWAWGVMVGALAWGLVSDRVLRARRSAALLAFALLALAWAPTTLLSDLPTGLLAPLLFLCAVGSQGVVVCAPLLMESLPRQVVGTAIGLVNAVTFLGAAVFQSGIGLALDAHGRLPGGGYPPSAYRAVFAVCLLSILAGAAAMLLVREPGPAERR